MLPLTSGCAFLKPFPEMQNLHSRLSVFPTKDLPLKGPAEIYWNAYQIPFVHATHDGDIPFLLGMVHAHLRLGQIELLRHLSQGRLSELFGPFVTNVDHALRILNLSKGVSQMAASLPDETRRWLERFAGGLTFYQEHTARLPPEFSFLGLKPVTWTLTDLLTMGRLASADVNWLYWFFLLRGKNEKAWPEIWARIKAHGQASLPSFSPNDGAALKAFHGAVKSGSNAFVVSGRRTRRGSAIIASDPHVGLMLPGLWLLVGFQSPSYQAVGFSIPGFPMVLIGRNPHIAWGGTNMLSLSSSLYDISALESDGMARREETIKVRWWFDRKIRMRDTHLGPIVTDSPYLKKLDLPPLALKWRGHRPSDETTAFLKVLTASSWGEFRCAFEPYAVSGQNFLYGDKEGNIGQLMAVEFSPAAGRAIESMIGDPADPDHTWTSAMKSTVLPAMVNPERGYLVSTNNIPVQMDPPISFFGNWNDRFTTISAALEKKNPASADDLKKIQGNVFSRDSRNLAKTILEEAGQTASGTDRVLSAISLWDGCYGVDSKGALAFELLTYHLASAYYKKRYGEILAGFLLRSPAVYAFLTQDLKTQDLSKQLKSALRKASKDFETYDVWGKFHFLRLAHPFGNIPVLGRKFRFGDYPVPGSTQTVMKSAHPLTNEKHFATYGASARHVSDLSDPDENYFVLLGGQDGYWGSGNFMDQVPLWRHHRYVRMPLRLETVRKTFAHRMALSGPKSTP